MKITNIKTDPEAVLHLPAGSLVSVDGIAFEVRLTYELPTGELIYFTALDGRYTYVRSVVNGSDRDPFVGYAAQTRQEWWADLVAGTYYIDTKNEYDDYE